MRQPLVHDDPEHLGAYRLLARLGSGGMGTVYLGRSRGGRTVALKTMHSHIASEPEFRTRFRLEVDAARVIGDRYGATVVDADPTAETPWLATEYVLGPPLDEAVALAGPLSRSAACALGTPLCEALAQLHHSDVVHRDLKPSNILLTAVGPKLIDFGIARAIGDERLTRTGTAAGTPAFMSPEQATGREHSPAGDVFALAGVLTFAVTGRGPFGEGQPADLLYRVRYAEPELTGVPEGLLPLLRRCLEKEPERRPEVGQLADELRELSAHRGPGPAPSHGAAGQDAAPGEPGQSGEPGAPGTPDERAVDGEPPEPDGPGGTFAEALPAAVRAEITRRCADAYRPPPAREAAPSEEDGTGDGRSMTGWPRSLPRRRMLAYSGGGALALAAAGWGAWSWGRGDGGGGGPVRRAANEPPKAVWETSIPEISPLGSLLTAGPLVLVPTEAGWVAIDAERGTIRWTTGKDLERADSLITDDDGRVLGTFGVTQLMTSHINRSTGTVATEITSTPAFDGVSAKLLAAARGSLYVRSEKTEEPDAGTPHLLRVDIDSGKLLWQRPLSGALAGDSVSTPTAAVSGRYLVTAQNQLVHVTDVRTGKLLWEREIGEDELDGELAPVGQLAVDRSRVYLASEEVLALRLRDGEVAWRFGKDRERPGESDGRSYGPPAVRGGTVYVSESQTGLVALDAASGEPRWEAKQKDQVAHGAFVPVVGERYVYNTLDDSRWIIAVDRERHRTAWSFTGLEAGGIGRKAVEHAASGHLVVASGSVVTAIPVE